MSEHVQDAKAVFLAALEKATQTERDAFVEAACAENDELLRRVRELLAFHDATRGPLDSPPPGLAGTAEIPPCEFPGTVIGPYKLLQQIGEGGMGVVFMAEQTKPVQRRVALKVIKPGMDSRQVIARFEAERQALAMMDHVNIARVIDGGTTESGRPFFVMELVNGVPITKYCDDNHLTPRERLELFIPVCQAIQHAHQKGIIHRDIKPSNVMVTLYDGKPVPKVIDFGVAKAMDQKLTDRTLFTNFGMMVGTLEYMSPEQAEMCGLGVDTRSDIYSLGVLLYELLTGSTPLEKHTFQTFAYAEVLRMIKDVEPPRPSMRLGESGEALTTISAQRKTEPAKLTKLVRGELDWIVMKTLEKDRNRRYETAGLLAEDVQQYLKNEPVKACPPSALYRFKKVVRRHRVAIITGSLVAIALIVSTVDSLYQMFEAKKARALADERLVNETNSRKLALAAVQRMLTRVADELLPNVPQSEQLRLKVYADAVEFYRSILRNRTDDPDLEYETAVGLISLGEMYIIVGHPELAVKEYQTAHQTLERLHREWPDDPRFRVQLARYFNRLHWQAYLTAEDTEHNIRRSIQLVQPVVDKCPAEFEIGGERVRTTLADCIRHQVALRGASLYYPSWGSKPVNYDPDAETELLRRALALCEDDSCPSLRVRAYCYGLLGGIELLQNQSAKALEHRKLAVSLAQKINQKNPTSPIYRYDLGCLLLSSGSCFKASGQPQEAESLMRQSVEWFERLEMDYPSSQVAKYQTVWVRGPLSRLYLELGDYQNVIFQIDKIEPVRSTPGRIELRPDSNGYEPGKPVSFMHWTLYRDRAIAHFHLKHFDKSLADLNQALKMAPQEFSILTSISPLEVAHCPDESFRKSFLAWIRNTIEKSTFKKSFALMVRGEIYAHMGQREEAYKAYSEALRDNPEDVVVLNNMAWLLATSPHHNILNPHQAVELAKKATKIAPTAGKPWNTLGTALYRVGDWKASVTALEKSLELLPSHRSFNLFFLAMCHWQLGKKEEATKFYSQAVQWMNETMPQDEELRRFRKEAAELMNIKEEMTTSK